MKLLNLLRPPSQHVNTIPWPHVFGSMLAILSRREEIKNVGMSLPFHGHMQEVLYTSRWVSPWTNGHICVSKNLAILRH